MSSLPNGLHFLERGWLSSNGIFLADNDQTVLIDSGYVKHAEQTFALLAAVLKGRPLDLLINTHLHSDHCGGNAMLQTHYQQLETSIPASSAQAVSNWDCERLTYQPTGQNCPEFSFQSILSPQQRLKLAGNHWDVYAAPGHDPESIILFQPEHRVLISADALWEHGFGVVFPEIEGQQGFEDIGKTLDLIESLNAQIILPGHGSMFSDVDIALRRARAKLAYFQQTPEKHASHAAKVLIKFKMLEFEEISIDEFAEWSRKVRYLIQLHKNHFDKFSFDEWIQKMIHELDQSAVLELKSNRLFNLP